MVHETMCPLHRTNHKLSESKIQISFKENLEDEKSVEKLVNY